LGYKQSEERIRRSSRPKTIIEKEGGKEIGKGEEIGERRANVNCHR